MKDISEESEAKLSLIISLIIVALVLIWAIYVLLVPSPISASSPSQPAVQSVQGIVYLRTKLLHYPSLVEAPGDVIEELAINEYVTAYYPELFYSNGLDRFYYICRSTLHCGWANAQGIALMLQDKR